ncbi:unnamed protein product [Menidia menidia]|uniref:(Atlantic silverside) hypothetical protein n=1 Tax=Menidia menidia TaxID=238744 RepID=A0A8S4AZ06_9TELE|nr:unnamed protein product [Menidia menidia]
MLGVAQISLLDAPLPFPTRLRGALHSEDVNRCEQQPCQNGGVCQNHGGGFQCLCSKQSLNGRLYESNSACTEPPSCPQALIIKQEYREVFPENTEIQYKCKDGYVTEEGVHMKSIFCRDGSWSEGPNCSRSSTDGNIKPTIIANPLMHDGAPFQVLDQQVMVFGLSGLPSTYPSSHSYRSTDCAANTSFGP